MSLNISLKFVPEVEINNTIQHWFRWWRDVYQVTIHYLNQWWLVYWRIHTSPGLNELIMTSIIDIIIRTIETTIGLPIILSYIQCETKHYSNVIMSTMASQITGVTILYSTVCSGADQRKHQKSASLAFVRTIDQSHRYGRHQAACREPAGRNDKTTRTAICFEHKT